MTLHPLTSKGGAFVLKLGSVFKNNAHHFGARYFLYMMPKGVEPGRVTAKENGSVNRF